MKDRILETDYVKKVIEELTNIPDISIQLRESDIVEARFIYMKVCSVFKSKLIDYSLKDIGKGINRDRTSVIHGLKKFENYKLYKKDIYQKALLNVKEHLDFYIEDDNKLNEKILKMHYLNKHIELSNKYRSVITKLQNKLSVYQNNPFIDKLASLDQQSLKEAEIKFDAFLKVKQAMKR